MKANCEICKKEFDRAPAHIARVKHLFCSRACRGISHRGSGNPMWLANEINCRTCKKLFKPREKTTKYCCAKCMGLARRNRLEMSCKICGRGITRPHVYKGTFRFCSKSCADEYHSIRMLREANPNWRGGISNLPWSIEFDSKLKNKIKSRDGNQCRMCGITADAIPKSRGYGLQIHHIDYDKDNNAESNLITLCNHCHGTVNYNKQKWVEYLSKVLES